jgi:DNA repair exonuclease SbcCD nuclease subunit
LKIAIINDTHFGARNDNVNFNEYFYQFYEKQFFPYLKENNITHCIHLGDIMDRRKFVSYRTAKDVRERFIKPFIEMGIELHVLIGNHDTYYKNTNDVNSVIELFGDRYKQIHIYPEAETVSFGDTPIMFVPWINNQNHTETLAKIQETNAQICMGHLEVAGFAMNKGIINEHGISKSIFGKFDTVFSGHFHHKSDDGHIFYLGAPYEFYWNDCDDRKGFHVFDTETRELERIENPLTIHSKIYYDDTQNDYTKYDVTQHKNNYVKVIVVNKKDLYKFDQFIDRILKADCHEVKIIEDFSDLDANTVSDDIVENTQDTMTLLGKYIEELDTTLNKERLINLQRQLYTEAQDLEL